MDITKYDRTLSRFNAKTVSAMANAGSALQRFGVRVDTLVRGVGLQMGRVSLQIQRGFLRGLQNLPQSLNTILGSMRRGLQGFWVGVKRGFTGLGPGLRNQAAWWRAAFPMTRAGFVAGAGARMLGRGIRGAGAMGMAGLGMMGRGLGAGAGMLGRGAGALGRGAGSMAMGGLGMLGAGAGALGRGGAGIAGGFISSFSSIRAAAASTTSFVTQKFRQLGYDIAYVGRRISMYLTAPIVAFATLSVASFAKFDDAMQTSISVMGGVSADVRKALEQQAGAISSVSRTAPTDIALGYFHLASAGYKAADALGAVAAVEKFSVAGAFDLNESGHAAGNSLFAMARATNYLVDTLAALGLRTGDTAKDMAALTMVGDVMTKANIISNATVQDFAKALTNKGAAAIRLLNKDIQEGTAVLAAFASQGVKGEAAGEKLYIITRDLARATIKHREAWQALGVTVFDTRGEMLHIGDIIKQLEKKMSGMSDEEKRMQFMMLGMQDRSLAATIQLLGMGDAIKAYDAELRKADGSMDKVVNIRLKSFTSQMMMTRNQLTLVAIDIGKLLLPAMMFMNDILKGAITKWNGLSEPFKKWTVYLLLGVAAIGPLLIGLGVMITTIATVVSGFVMFKSIVVALAPAALILSGVILGLVLLLSGEKGLAGAWDFAMRAASSFMTFTIGFLENFSANMGILVKWFGDNWKNMFSDAGNLIMTFVGNMTYNFMVGIDTLMRLFSAFFGWFMRQVDDLFSGKFSVAIVQAFVDALAKITNILMEWSLKAVNIMTAVINRAPMQIVQAAVSAASYLQGLRQDTQGGYTNNNLGGAMNKILGEQGGKLKGATAGFTPKTKLPDFITDIKKKSEEAFEPMEKFGNAVATVKDELDEGIVANFSVKGLEAVEARSAKFFRMFMEFQGNMKTIDPTAAAPKDRAGMLAGKKAAFADMMDKRRAITAKVSPRRAAVLAQRQKTYGDNRATAAIAQINEADREGGIQEVQRLGRTSGALAQDVGSGVGEAFSGMDILIPAIRGLTLAVVANTEATEDSPTIELTGAGLAGEE